MSELEQRKAKMENVVKQYNFEYEWHEDYEMTVIVHTGENPDDSIWFGIIDYDVPFAGDHRFYAGIYDDYIDACMFNDPISYEDSRYTEDYSFYYDDFDKELENHIIPAMHVILHAFKSGINSEYLN